MCLTCTNDINGNIVCVIILSATLMIMLGLNIFIYRIKTEDDRFMQPEYSTQEIQTFPYFCDDLSLSPDEDEVTFHVRKKLYEVHLHEKRYVCTFRNLTEPLHKFVEKISRQRVASGQGGKRYLQCGNTSLRQPSGHGSAAFRRISGHQANEVGESETVIHWDKHPEISIISKGIEYHKGKIKVTEGGFYFIYTTVLLNLTKAMVETGKMYRFALYICAIRKGYERTLLSSFKFYNTSCKNDVTYDQINDATTLSIQGNFYIAKDESVYVKISDTDSLIRDSVGNTFGIILAG